MESAAISSREDPVKLLTNLREAKRTVLRRRTSERFSGGVWGTFWDSLLLEELVRVDGLVVHWWRLLEGRWSPRGGGGGVEERGSSATAPGERERGGGSELNWIARDGGKEGEKPRRETEGGEGVAHGPSRSRKEEKWHSQNIKSKLY